MNMNGGIESVTQVKDSPRLTSKTSILHDTIAFHWKLEIPSRMFLYDISP